MGYQICNAASCGVLEDNLKIIYFPCFDEKLIREYVDKHGKSDIMIAKSLTQEEAHVQATAKYNYDKEAHEYYGKIKKYKKE